MRVDLREDHAASRRHRVAFLVSGVAIVATLPVGLMLAGLLRMTLGPGAAADRGPAVFLVAPLVGLVAFLVGAVPTFHYRCPSCRGRARRVDLVGAGRPNLLHHCSRCSVVWDLGWGWGEKG